MALVLHDGHLGPLVLLDFVLFDGVEALLAAEATKHEDVAAAHRDCVRVPRLVHRALVRDFVLQCQVESSVFLRGRATTCDQDFCRCQRDRSTALVKLACAAITELLDGPLVLVHIVAEANFRVDIVTEKVDPRRLVLRSLY